MSEPRILLAPTKEEDLCRALSMVEDMPTLLERAIKAYQDSGELRLAGVIQLQNISTFLDSYKKLKREYEAVFYDLMEMHGLDPLEVPYGN